MNTGLLNIKESSVYYFPSKRREPLTQKNELFKYTTMRSSGLDVICTGNLEVSFSLTDSIVAAAVCCFCRMCIEPYAPVRTYQETRKLAEK
jgi:hypothetical protein